MQAQEWAQSQNPYERVLDPSNDLAGLIDSCVEDAGACCTLSFDPPYANHPDECRDLKVVVGKPGLATRTNTRYYNQPQPQADVSK